jgi:hypothetical protein
VEGRERLWQPTPKPVDWLHNILTVTGPAERVEDFRGAAAGPGVIPWTLDLAGLEEDFLLRHGAGRAVTGMTAGQTEGFQPPRPHGARKLRIGGVRPSRVGVPIASNLLRTSMRVGEGFGGF